MFRRVSKIQTFGELWAANVQVSEEQEDERARQWQEGGDAHHPAPDMRQIWMRVDWCGLSDPTEQTRTLRPDWLIVFR